MSEGYAQYIGFRFSITNSRNSRFLGVLKGTDETTDTLRFDEVICFGTENRVPYGEPTFAYPDFNPRNGVTFTADEIVDLCTVENVHPMMYGAPMGMPQPMGGFMPGQQQMPGQMMGQMPEMPPQQGFMPMAPVGGAPEWSMPQATTAAPAPAPTTAPAPRRAPQPAPEPEPEMPPAPVQPSFISDEPVQTGPVRRAARPSKPVKVAPTEQPVEAHPDMHPNGNPRRQEADLEEMKLDEMKQEYNFETAKGKFNKDEIFEQFAQKESVTSMYDKSSSFFDTTTAPEYSHSRQPRGPRRGRGRGRGRGGGGYGRRQQQDRFDQ